MSVEEMEAIRDGFFGSRYRRIRNALKESADDKTKREFRQMEDLLFFLISDILDKQNPKGWWNYGNPYYKVLTAHAVRHLRRMGLTLKSRWNLYDRKLDKGNLLYSTEQLLKCFREPSQKRHSRWEVDIWDDCWILLAFLEVQPDFEDREIQRWLPHIKNEFDRKYRKSVNWLEKQFDKRGRFNQKVEEADWYGPAHYASAIELFDHPKVKDDFRQANNNVEILARAVKPMLEQEPSARKWDRLFAWHVGQFVVTWKEKRKDYFGLRELDGVIQDLFKELQKRQNKDGFWGAKGANETVKVYNTVRALAGCYVNTPDDDLLNSKSISRAHKYLLQVSQNNSGAIEDIKGSINALEALQKLFDFRLREIFPNILFIMAGRLNSYGILDNILNPRDNDSESLKEVRAGARRRLESQGNSSLEVLGVNDQLFQVLSPKDEFIKEFISDRQRIPSEEERDKIRNELAHFLSATITETRSRSAQRLIRNLWQPDGFLNFIPLIGHLAQLEQDGAFYKYYRDHLNHEVLLFLLGAYIYYNCAVFKNAVDNEICEIYDDKQIRFDRRNLEGEFLFRWKLISTFHDIGYLFEVDPVDKSRTKAELLAKSFGVVDEFRDQFLFEYLLQYIKTKTKPGLSAKQAESRRAKDVRRLAEEIAQAVTPYSGTIKGTKDLLNLSSVKGTYSNAFKLISQYVKPVYIKTDLIENYFKLCATTRVSKIEDGKKIERGKFLDHGIMSALVLLKAADIQRHYLRGLIDTEFSGQLDNYPQLRDILARADTKAHISGDQFFIRFSHVAGAIALHNISPHLYTDEQCEAFDTRNGTELKKAFHRPIGSSGRYLISLEENPLSYLTALADTLQDWDRHSFRRLSFGDDSGDPLSSSEVFIGFENDKINVQPLTNQASKKYHSMTQPGAMDQYLKDWRRYLTINSFEPP